jgi:imidazolonepropionase-like amidohydrolase
MKFSPSVLGLLVFVGLLVATMLILPTTESRRNAEASASTPATYALTNARVFDGETVHERATVLVRGGRVDELLIEQAPPEGVEIIDLDGGTLLPGLIDGHVHAFNSARRDALRFGVTTVLDMFRPPFDFDQTRAERERLDPSDKADLFSAGFLATVEGGHGTQYGIEVPTVAGPDDAEAWVEARLAEGSDYIKIVIESGSAWRGELPTLDAETVEALVAAAQRRGVMAVAHVSTQAAARMAVEAGVDGLVHLFVDEPLDPALAQRLVDDEIFVVPTTTVLAGSHGQSGRGWLEAAENLAERLSGEQRQTLEQQFPGSALRAGRWPMVFANLRALHEAGVVLLAGSDAPNAATASGASLLHEIKLLHEAGLSTIDALRAATSVPAERFALDGRGCLRPGCRADLVWFDGDPIRDIDELRRVQGVWKNGVRIALPVDEPARVGADSEPLTLPIDLHAVGQWMASTDEFMGGQSTAVLAQGEAGQAVRVRGELNPGFPFPYAGAMWNPGDAMMSAVNLSPAETLSLHLEAEAGSFQLMIFSGQDVSGAPVRIDLVANETNRIDLTGYSSLDLSRLRAIGVYAAGSAQAYEFSIREARLQ